MDIKEIFYKYKQKVQELWKDGKIQRSSRITYDVFWNIILFFLVIGFIGLFFAGGIGAGYFASLVKDEPVRSYEDMEADIYDYSETSKLYFAGEQYFGDIRSDIHREETELENVADVLIDAVIATEDEYFEVHEGIVPKAIFRAMVQEVTNASVQTGGSTLTQQLIKNQVLTNEVSFERKAKEILLALRLERFFEKDEILEAYLNIVPYGRDVSGRNIAGIQTAAQGIFGLDADEVNLPQAAYLAGLPQSPSSYTPFTNTGGVKEEEGLQPGLNRMQSVLDRMLDSEYITQEEYDEASSYDIVADFREDYQSPIETYPYLTYALQEEAKEKLTKVLAEADGYTAEDLNNDAELKEEYEMSADRDLRNKGYQIHSTIDKEIYDAMKQVTKNFENFGPDTVTTVEFADGKQEINQQVEAGAILIENNTGRIISFVGGREYTDEDQVNYALNAPRSNGSTMKPLLVYGPAMEVGAIQPGTPVLDANLPTASGYNPNNYSGTHYGLVPARKALYNSYNNSTARIYEQIMAGNPVEKYLEKMGITSLGENEYANPSLSIGGTTNGITVEENVNAFATFGNNGKFADAYMIEKITTEDGETIYEEESEPVEVFSPQTAYLTVDMMRDVMDKGTGTYVNTQLANPGVDWAGKSGTAQNWKDVWFVGTNPNVTFGTWMGYRFEDSLYRSSDPQGHSHRVQRFWAQLINNAAEVNPELVTPSSPFQQPEGIVSRSYCAISGMLPSDLCEQAGLVKTDLFNANFVPTESDDSLIRGNNLIVDGQAVSPGSNTPSEFADSNGLTFNPEFLARKGYDRLNSITQLYPNTNRDLWEKIGAPGSSSGGTIENDGNPPSPPASLNVSGGNLTWNQSSNSDVVGYRIFKASGPENDFSLVGDTTGTSYSIDNNNAVYHVKAVDYFGLESSASSQVIVGEPEEPEGDTPDDEQDSNENNTEENNEDNSNPTDEEANNESNNSEDNNSNNDEENEEENNDGNNEENDESSDDNNSSD
ncbi:transglycosylase domain-containing protein [Virgibacillus ainsalahensis]